MTKNKIVNLVPFFFVLLFIVLVILISWYIYPSWQSTEQGLFKLFLAALIGSTSFIADITQILSYFKQSPSQPGNTVSSTGDHAQAAAGKRIRQVQTNGGPYIEKAIFPAPAEPAATPEPANNVIPSPTSEKYILRGPESPIKAILLGQNGVPLALVHGPHGMGKSELATHISNEIKGNFENTLCLSLGNRPLEQVLIDFLRLCALKIPEAVPDQVQVLQAHLSQHHFLIVLDDLCESQIAGLKDLLPPASCSTLITSCIQQPSHLISLTHSFPLDRMDEKQGIELFDAALGADLVQAEAQALPDLIERCAGNPLALEMSARRIHQLSNTPHPIGSYLARLQHSLDVLKVGREARLDLFAVFDQTYDFLPQAEQACFRKLSVLAPTGFSPAAAMAVWELDQSRTEEVIQHLLNLYFLKPMATANHRYQLHDLLLEYAAKKSAQDEQSAAYRSLTNWLIQLFSDYYTGDISTAPDVGLELDNLRRAAGWAMQSHDGQSLARLATMPRNWLFNYFRNLDEWLLWLQTALNLGISEDQLKASTLWSIGDVQQFKSQNDDALLSYQSALALFRSVSDPHGEANTLMSIGDVQYFKDQYDAALRSYQAALALFRSIGEQLGEANTLMSIGDVQQFKKQTDDALLSYQASLALFRSIGDALGEANTLMSIGDVQQFKKQTDDALRSYQAALALFRSIGHPLGEANTLKCIGDVQRFKVQYEDALRSYQDALDIFRSVGDHLGEANTLLSIGDVQRFKVQYEDALRSYQDALDIFRSVGSPLGEANTLAAQSRLLVREGKMPEAEQKLQEALALRRQIRDVYSEGSDNYNFALALLDQREFAKAIDYAQNARSLYQAIPLPDHVDWTDRLLEKIQRQSQANPDSEDESLKG